MHTVSIPITLPLPGEKPLSECNNAELSAAMNYEIDSFDHYMKSMGQDKLVPVERTLIKTFLAWKLNREAVRNSNKD